MKKNSGKLLNILICGLLGAAVFLFLYGPDSLHVTFDWWILNGYVEEDIVQHYTGWMAFRDSAWHFPLGVTDRIGYPVGAVISFTDSLPLVSVLLKCISGILPETFQFFGWYVLGCFILQSVAAGLLTGLFTKKRWGIYGMSLLFSFAPVFVERAFRHTALASHWLLLFAFFFYFKAKKERKIPWGFLALSFLVVGLHPYFLPMVFGVLAVWTLEQVFGAKGGRIKALGFFFVNVIITLAVGYVLGIFGSGVEGASGGFGYYSMNLNALWNPTSKGMATWSKWLPVLPQLDGNLKGFAHPDSVLTAPETRSSSPVRIIRDETCQSRGLRGLYPAGEGAGYAGGIMSAAIDGIMCAEALMEDSNDSFGKSSGIVLIRL